MDSPDKNYSLTEVAGQILNLPPWDENSETSFKLLTPVFRGMPPSIADIFMFDSVRQAAIGNELIEEQLNAGLYFTQFISYLLYLILMAERRGVALYTWSNDFQQAIWTARKLLPQTDGVSNGLIPIREAAASQLANVILTRHLTRVDGLPFDEILSIRKKRTPELQGFRSGVAELATEIDLDASPPEIELQLHDLVSAKVDPTLRNLTSALKSSRSEALMKIGHSSLTKSVLWT